MSFVVEDANKVWQRVDNTLKALSASPEAFQAFRDVKAYLAQARSNPQLKFSAIDVSTNGADASNAAVVASDTANEVLVGIYVKKNAGSTTVAYDAISDHASAIQAAKEILLGSPNTDKSQESFMVHPKGRIFGTGITYSSVTAYNGTTRSNKADSSNGFIITASRI